MVNHHPNTATASDTFQLWGMELNGLLNLKDQLHFQLILLAGIRYMNITEKFTLNDAVYQLPTFPNSVVNIRDNFSTDNNFYGLQMGIHTHLDWHKFIFDTTGIIALGENHQKLDISGQINENNIKTLFPTGTFAEHSNTGSFRHNQFTAIPELRTKISYKLNHYAYPFIAYNFFYINNLIRPGNQIDRNINLTQNQAFGGTGVLSGPRAPNPRFNNSNMWVQGLSIGIEVRV